MQVYRPDGAIGQESLALSPPAGSLSGLRIAVVDNGKPNADLVMTHLAQALAARCGATLSVITQKGPQGLTANAAIPAAADVVERVQKEADIVITGSADCGSCTAYSVYDAIEFEKLGLPSVVVTTTRFAPIAESMALHFGMPALRTLVLPHPIGGTDPQTLQGWAEAAVEETIGLLHRAPVSLAISLADRAALVTGGGAGIGAATAQAAGGGGRRGHRQRHRRRAG